MSDFPSFLASQDDLQAHVADSFSGLSSVEKGTRFATFASRLVCLLPEFREFGEARLSSKLSHDGGVDIESDQLDDGRRLCAQAKLSLSGKDDIDSIISKFHDCEQCVSTGPSQGDLLAAKTAHTKPVFGILSLSRLEGILRRYKASSSATRTYYDRLIEEQRLHVIDGTRILKTLQNAYARTFGVPSEFRVRSQAGWIRHGSVRFGVMKASDLAALYHEHGDGLFFENIRTFLGPTSGQVAPDQPTVNEEISATIRTNPEHFLERNNGVTIKAKAVAVDGEPDTLALTDASIVNGCQTTMSLVDAAAPIEECSISIKVIESDHAWDVAKSANFQNTVDKIELELARYLRPQVVQMAASGAGVEVDGAAKTNAVAMLGSVYNSKVQYEEVRILYIGLMSETPNNIGDNLYTKLIDALISGFAAEQAEQDALIETLFKIVLATHQAIRELENKIGQEDYMKPFLRVFHERKPQYRIFFAILTLCVLIKDDLSERSKDRTKELERMRKFMRRARQIVDAERASFVATYAHAVAAMAAEAWGGTSDENRLRQSLSGILKRGFKGMYGSLSMKIDLMQKIGPAG